MKNPSSNMTTFLVWGILIMPWVFNPTTMKAYQFRLPQALFMICLFMGIIIHGLRRQIKENYLNGWVIVFIGYLFFKLIINMFLPIFISNPSPTYMILPMVIVIVTVPAVYFITNCTEKIDFIRIAKAFCLSGVLISIFSLLQYFEIDPFKMALPFLFVQNSEYRCGNTISACLDNPNLVGMYLTLVSPLFLYFKKFSYYAGYILCLITVILSRSHLAWACFAVSILLYLCIELRKNKIALLNIVILSSIGLIILAKMGILYKLLKMSTMMSGRLECWKMAWGVFKKSPLFGWGLGFYNTLQITITNPLGKSIWHEVHNDYLQYLIEIGFVGVALFIIAMIKTVDGFRFGERIADSFFVMFLTFLMFMFGSFPMEVASVGFLGIVSFCVVTKLKGLNYGKA